MAAPVFLHLAEWILEKPERVQYFQEMYLINTDVDYIFRYWR